MSPGPVIKQIRKQKRLNQKQLAQASGIRQPNISRIERGRTSPTERSLKKLAAALAVDVSEFFNPERQAMALADESTEEERAAHFARALKGKRLYVYINGELLNPPGTIGRLELSPMRYTGKEPCAGERLDICFAVPVIAVAGPGGG